MEEMLNHLTLEILDKSCWKRIKDLGMVDDILHIEFDDGSKIKIFDDGQQCCETRYMMTDDNLGDFVGSTFLGIDLREGPEVTESENGYHQTQFLLVLTSLGQFTMVTHNDHNGYYSGFYVVVREDD